MKSVILWPKKLIIAMIALIVATPLGILIVWGYGDAWVNGAKWVIGFRSISGTHPCADYDLSGWDSQLMASFGYIISAIVGIAAIIVLTYVLYLAVSKRRA